MKFFNQNNNELAKRENSLFDPFFGSIFGNTIFDRNFQNSKLMKTDVTESDEGYNLSIEVPGFDKNEIELNLNEGYLTISASKVENKDEKDKKGNYIRQERCYSSTERSFYVGENICEDDIDASLTNGILNLFIPKKQAVVEEKKKILIK